MGEKGSARNILNFLCYFRWKTLKTLKTKFRAARKKRKKSCNSLRVQSLCKETMVRKCRTYKNEQRIYVRCYQTSNFREWWLFFPRFCFGLSVIILFGISKLFTGLFQTFLIESISKGKLDDGWYENRTSPGKICDSKVNIQLLQISVILPSPPFFLTLL